MLKTDFYFFLILGVVALLILGVLSLFVAGITYWLPIGYGIVSISAICRILERLDSPEPEIGG